MAGSKPFIYIDVSGVSDLTDKMRKRLDPKEFDVLMTKAIRETAKHANSESKKILKHQYYTTSQFTKSAYGKIKISGGHGSITAQIPIEGPKGTVGGTFAAQGGHYGWNPPKYKITAKIVKGKASELPSAMRDQGGQPPFRNMGGGGKQFIGKKTKISAKKYMKMRFAKVNNGNSTIVFTRNLPEKNPFYTKAPKSQRVKYHSVSGLAVAQMIMNRSKSEIEQDIRRNLETNVEKQFGRIWTGI